MKEQQGQEVQVLVKLTLKTEKCNEVNQPIIQVLTMGFPMKYMRYKYRNITNVRLKFSFKVHNYIHLR